MNPLERDMPPNDDRRFDLLVDGELSEAERRELLAGLDDEPGAWRRCALAFLEAQCWRRELGAVRDEAVRRPGEVSPVTAARSASPGRRLRRWFHPTVTLLAVAASFLVAMALGWWIFGPGQADDYAPGPPAQLAGNDTPPGAPTPGGGQLAGQESVLPPDPGTSEESVPGRWRWVALAPADGLPDGAEPIRLPAVEAREFDEGWLRSLPAGIPSEVLSALRRAGHRVRYRRDLAPFVLEDGRRLLVPVDELDVHYVGNKRYQ